MAPVLGEGQYEGEGQFAASHGLATMIGRPELYFLDEDSFVDPRCASGKKQAQEVLPLSELLWFDPIFEPALIQAS